MNKNITKLIQLNTLRDIEIKLLKLKQEGQIVTDNVFESISELEEEYKKKAEECDTCNGTGKVTQHFHDPREADGHGEREVECECKLED